MKKSENTDLLFNTSADALGTVECSVSTRVSFAFYDIAN